MVKLIYRHASGEGMPIPVSQAVEHFLSDPYDTESGVIESINNVLELQAAYLAKLTEMLVERGVLPVADLQTLLGSNYKLHTGV